MTFIGIRSTIIQINHVHSAGGLINLFGGDRIIRLGLFCLRARPRAAAAACLGFIVFGGHRFCIGALFFQQRFTVGDRDLIIIRVDFREGQEPVAVSAIVNKCRLKRRFDPCYFCQINVASELAFVFGFKVEFFNLVPVDHHNPSFLGVGGVDKHLLCHVVFLHPDRRARPGGRAWGKG